MANWLKTYSSLTFSPSNLLPTNLHPTNIPNIHPSLYIYISPFLVEFSAAQASKEATDEAVGSSLWDLTKKIVT